MRIGLIVPSSNTVMEPDFHRQIGRTAIVSTTRIFPDANFRLRGHTGLVACRRENVTMQSPP